MPKNPEPTQPPDPAHIALLLGGEIHARADGRPLLAEHDFDALVRSLPTARERGFRDLALELPRDLQPLVDDFLAEVQSLYAPGRKTKEDSDLPDWNIDKNATESWTKTWDQATQRYGMDKSDELEWGEILSKVAWINAGHPEEPIRVYCIDVPSQKQAEAWKSGDLFCAVSLPQSCQGEIDRYVSRAEALARERKRPSEQEQKELGEGLMARLREGNPSFGQNPAERNALFAQVSHLCRGGENTPGLDEIAAERVFHPERSKLVKTAPVDNSTYWKDIHSQGASYPQLAPAAELTSRFLDARDRSMAEEIGRIAASAQKETPCFGILTWNGLLHLGPSGQPVSSYDPRKRETSLPEELHRRGFSEISLYRCGREKESLEDRISGMGDRIDQWKEERARKAPVKEPEEKAKAPSPEERPGDRATLPPVPMTREGQHSRTVRRRIPAFGMDGGVCPEIEEEIKEDRKMEAMRQPEPRRPSGPQPTQDVRRPFPAFGQEKLDRIGERGGQEERAWKAPAKEPEEKAKAPSPEKAPEGQARLPSVSMTREGLRSLFGQPESSRKSLAPQGRVLSPEEAGEELRRRSRTGFTPGQERFLAELRKRQAETKLDLREQPIGVLRRAAESVVGTASARLRELPAEPAASRSVLLVERDPERKERIAALLSRLPVCSREDPAWREQEACFQAYRAKTEELVRRIPEIPDPWEMSVGKAQSPAHGQTYPAIGRNRGIDRGGR